MLMWDPPWATAGKPARKGAVDRRMGDCVSRSDLRVNTRSFAFARQMGAISRSASPRSKKAPKKPLSGSSPGQRPEDLPGDEHDDGDLQQLRAARVRGVGEHAVHVLEHALLAQHRLLPGREAEAAQR